MGGSNSWRIPETLDDYLRTQEKRLLHEERRPSIRVPSDLMGPGLAPFAVQVTDWNDDATAFNGFFWSEPLALNSPDTAKYWMGTSMATPDGYGIQRVWEFRDGTLPPDEYVRTFESPADVRTYSVWTAVP